MPELGETWMVRLRNAALTYRNQVAGGVSTGLSVDVTVTLSRAEMYELLTQRKLEAARRTSKGDVGALVTLLDLCGIVCT